MQLISAKIKQTLGRLVWNMYVCFENNFS